MSVVCKLFIQTATHDAVGTTMFNLGVVCRGEENKDWAAATPSGSMKHGSHPVLERVWLERQNGERANPEVLVRQIPHPKGDWTMDSCDFAWNGCVVKFRQPEKPWGTLELTVNATGASAVLRRAYAEGLLAGERPRFRIEIAPAD